MLRDAGVAVDVVTDAATGAVPGTAPGGERIAVITKARTMRERILASRQTHRPAAAAAAATEPARDAESARIPHPSWLRQQVRSLLVVPDLDRGLIGPMARRTRRLLGEGPAIVYSSGPPQSVHLAASLALMGHRVPWISEFRDPWFPDQFDGFSGDAVGARIADRLLRAAFRRVDWCIAATDGIGRWWEAYRVKAPVLVARNGIPQRTADDEPIDEQVATDGPDVLYVGELYAGRDPRRFFASIRTCMDRNAAWSDLRVRFVGEVAAYGRSSTRSLADQAGLGDTLSLHGSVPNAEALRLQRASKVLLLLAQNQPRQVPNKLYEYLGARRPILAYVDDEGESATLLRQAGGHFLVTERHTPAEADAIVAAALDAGRRGTPVGDAGFLAALSTETQLRFVVDLMMSVGRDRLGWG